MRRVRAGAVLALAVGVGVAGAVSGCAPTPTRMPADAPLVVFVQQRSDVASRQAQVRVTNGGESPIEVGDVEVHDARFVDAAERTDPDRATTVRPGATVDIRVQLPAMDCDADAAGDADGDAAALLDVDGDVVRLPIVDLLGVIPALHERECRAERLAAAAEISFGSFTPSPPGEPGVLELVIAPTERAGAHLTAIRPTNLLAFDKMDAGDGRYPIGLSIAPGDDTVVRLPLRPARCDAHAVQEDKRGTVFTLEVEIDGEPGEVELAAPEELRGRILAWVTDWCESAAG